jgi:hypothetical protein
MKETLESSQNIKTVKFTLIPKPLSMEGVLGKSWIFKA